MRNISLAARTALRDASSAEVEIVLIMIHHADLAKPIRLSSDPTETISEDPVMYGTRSTWQTPAPSNDPFLAVPISTRMPSDLDDAPASANLVIDLVDEEILSTLRSFRGQATADIAVVLSSDTNSPEVAYYGLMVTSFSADTGEVTVFFDRQPIEDEPHPADRMTRERFPALHR